MGCGWGMNGERMCLVVEGRGCGLRFWSGAGLGLGRFFNRGKGAFQVLRSVKLLRLRPGPDPGLGLVLVWVRVRVRVGVWVRIGFARCRGFV